MNQSIIIRYTVLFIRFVNTIWDNSIINKIIRMIQFRFRHGWKSSIVGKPFVKESKLNNYLYDSFFYKAIDFLFNGLTKAIRKRYQFNIIRESIFFKIFEILNEKIVLFLGAYVIFVIITPHQYWKNQYSLLVAIIFFMWIFVRSILANKPFDFSGINIYFLIFVLAITFGFIFSLSIMESTRFVIFYITCFIFVIVILSIIRDKDDLEKFIEFLLIGIGISGIYGVYQKIVGIPVIPSFVDTTMNENLPGRVFAAVDNPNNFAEIIIMAIPFYFSIILYSKNIFKKVGFAVLLGFVFVSLILTSSRSSWIGFFVGFCVYMFFKNKKLIPVFIGLGILAIPFMPAAFFVRINSIPNAMNDSSFFTRILIYKTVYPMLKDYWMIGYGIGTDIFIRIVNGYYTGQAGIPRHSHSLLLQIWLESGIIGIGSFLVFIGSVIKMSILNLKTACDKMHNDFLLAGVMAIISIMVAGLVEYIWYYPRVMLLFWILVAIILAANKILNKSPINH